MWKRLEQTIAQDCDWREETSEMNTIREAPSSSDYCFLTSFVTSDFSPPF